MKCKIIKVAGTEKYPFACVIKIGYYVTDRICSKEKAKKVMAIGRKYNELRGVVHELALLSVDLKMIAQGVVL